MALSCLTLCHVNHTHIHVFKYAYVKCMYLYTYDDICCLALRDVYGIYIHVFFPWM